MRSGIYRFRLLLVLFLSSLAVAFLPGSASAVTATSTIGGTAMAVPSLLSSNPSDVSPQIPVGSDAHGRTYSVEALASVGDMVYMGGWFPSVKATSGATYGRHNLAAYNAVTGAVGSFNATVDGVVASLAVSPDRRVLYIGGDFTHVNGTARRGMAALDLASGALKSSFNANFASGKVNWVEYTCGKLWAGGTIPGKLRTLDPLTGTNTGYQNLVISGTVKSNTPTRVERFDVSPTCLEMVVLGNFTSVGAAARRQVFRLGMGTAHVALSKWYSPAWNVTCSTLFANYTRAVSYSPTGSYFTIAATGSPGPRGVTQYCDSLTRWPISSLSPNSSPVWTQKTGGDTLMSVADTGQTVCAGGHPRWADNPFGRDYAGAGAVASPGFLCVSAANGRSVYVSSNGRTYRWNVTRSRGIGAAALLLMSASNGKKYLIIGSDTSGGGKLGCSQPGGGIDCSQPVNQPGVAARAAACLPVDNFAHCTGLVQENHAGVGQLPAL